MQIRRYSALVFALALLAASCSDDRALNEQNTFFKRAEVARQEGNFGVAIDNYRSCLFYSPQSHKAHLQLAILLEENRHDLPGAIAHYTAYLEATGGKDETVRRMLRCVEKKYYLELHERYRGESEAATPALAAAKPPAPPPQPVPPAAPKPKPRYYVVQTGDNLSKISNKVYGTARHWELIYNANRRILPTPARLKVGMTLIIPEQRGVIAPGGSN